MGSQTAGRDLHEGFRDPRRVPAGDLVRFLEEADTLAAAWPPDPDVSAWVDEQGAAAARGEFVAAFTGVLTTGVR